MRPALFVVLFSSLGCGASTPPAAHEPASSSSTPAPPPPPPSATASAPTPTSPKCPPGTHWFDGVEIVGCLRADEDPMPHCSAPHQIFDGSVVPRCVCVRGYVASSDPAAPCVRAHR